MKDQEIDKFRRLMGLWTTGIAIVMTDTDDVVTGMTINSLTSVSLNPLLLLICVRNGSATGTQVIKNGRFSVNILSEDQEGVSRQFSGGPAGADKLVYEETGRDITLQGAMAAFHCNVENTYPGGDHQIIVSKVTGISGQQADARPLLFHKGGYAMLEPE